MHGKSSPLQCQISIVFGLLQKLVKMLPGVLAAFARLCQAWINPAAKMTVFGLIVGLTPEHGTSLSSSHPTGLRPTQMRPFGF
jgi:hypothetical protein